MATPEKVAIQFYGSAGKEWTPHMWQGMDFFGWMRLLMRNRFAVHPSCWYIAIIVTLVSVFHTLLRYIQDLWFGERVRQTKLTEPPLFILGHWRTGTTLLHELLIVDERHTYPNTYECLEPNHFLLSEPVLTRLFWFFMPSRRPMDNMASGWDRPQEDEFALCMMGQPSPYLTIAFPNHPPQDQEALDLEELPPRAVRKWKAALLGFMQRITYRRPGRLILKSPTHTCRIKTLLEMFPEARFVHIVRDPYVVFPSTVNLWQSLYRTHGIQIAKFAGLEEHVFQTFTRMYKKLDQGRCLVDPAHFYELRYEELVSDPLAEMRKLYAHLNLGGFEAIKPRLEHYLARTGDYKTNQYIVTPEMREEIGRRWGDVIRRYGYEMKEEPTTPASAPSVPKSRGFTAAVVPPHLDRWPQVIPEKQTAKALR
jgi:hypothetical protein